MTKRRVWTDAEIETVSQWTGEHAGEHLTWRNKNTPGGELTEVYHRLLDTIAEITDTKRTTVGWVVRNAIRGVPRYRDAAIRAGFIRESE